MDLKRRLINTTMNAFAAGLGVGLATWGFAADWPWLALAITALSVGNGVCVLLGTGVVVRGIEAVPQQAVPQEPSR